MRKIASPLLRSCYETLEGQSLLNDYVPSHPTHSDLSTLALKTKQNETPWIHRRGLYRPGPDSETVRASPDGLITSYLSLGNHVDSMQVLVHQTPQPETRYAGAHELFIDRNEAGPRGSIDSEAVPSWRWCTYL